MTLQIFFWLALFILFYSYLGYALIAAVILQFRTKLPRNKIMTTEYYPEVALVIPVFNELDCLENKIENCLSLDYDQHKLQVIFVTDGSDDGSPELISTYPQFTLLHQPYRKGKAAAINRAMTEIIQELVIFSDANTLLNSIAIKEIVKHYVDDHVGGVAGEKKISSAQKSKAVNAGEGFYWTYESWLKAIDSNFYSVVGAAGELFSIRRSLYEPMPEDIILDDFVMSLRLCIAGYVVRYEPGAYATETASVSMSEEKKRKVRISSGGFQAMGRLKPLFNLFKHPALTYLYISHRVLRWTICPFLLPSIFLINWFLSAGSTFYQCTLAVQVIFYLCAFIGSALASRNIRVKILFIPYYFLFMNWSLVLGLYRFLFLKPSVLWEKSKRER